MFKRRYGIRYGHKGLWGALPALPILIAVAWAASQPAAAQPGASIVYSAPAAVLPAGSATPDPTPCDGNYTYVTSTSVIVPGTNLVPGSRCGLCTTNITLPFAFNFYGQDYTSANLSSQGNMQFTTNYTPTPLATVCPLPEPELGPAILPHWDTILGTGWHNSCEDYTGSPCGIYTSTTGLAPNRIFNIEWRAQVMSTSQHTAQFEVRLHEGTNTIDYEYAWISYGGSYASIGLQDGGTRFTAYACHVSGSAYAGLQISWTPPQCGPPPPTATPTPTPAPGCLPIWIVVSNPTAPHTSFLYSVAAVGPDDIWAVGRSPDPNLNSILILHWDGTQWSIATTPPATQGYYATLRGVSARSASDVWAVGYTTAFDDPAHQYSLTLHWNGSAWSIISSPNPGGTGANYLSAVKAISASDVWAVGYFSDQASPGGVRAFFLRWNGSAWSDVSVPDIGPVGGMSVLTAGDIWAVGEGGTMHWNGLAWSFVPSQILPLYGVKAVTASDAWAVGAGRELAHWDGTAWRAVANPVAGQLYAVTAVGPGDLWAVGARISTGTWQTLTEHAYESCSSGTPTGTPTSTGTPTATPLHGTATATATVIATGTHSPTPAPSPEPGTATPCSITFTDVHPTDYFYEPVRYLYCTGAISGYADGTFRPFSSTTRGQLCKIVVLAEGMPINTAGGPHFSDVPTNNPFYAFIETAYNAGIISGYSDGTLRWGSNITRGQLSKIVVSAEGWVIDTIGGPHFSDVPATDPFYVFIETAYNHAVISGYADGTFRPGNSATRGQIAKIVYNAITGP